MAEETRNRLEETYRSEVSYRILHQIHSLEEPTTSEITKRTQYSRSTISYYIKLLKESGLIKSEREGRKKILSLNHTNIVDYYIKLIRFKAQRTEKDRKPYHEKKLENELKAIKEQEEESQKLLSLNMMAYLSSYSSSTIEEMFLDRFLDKEEEIGREVDFLSPEIRDSFSITLQYANGEISDYRSEVRKVLQEGIPEPEEEENQKSEEADEVEPQ